MKKVVLKHKNHLFSLKLAVKKKYLVVKKVIQLNVRNIFSIFMPQ